MERRMKARSELLDSLLTRAVAHVAAQPRRSQNLDKQRVANVNPTQLRLLAEQLVRKIEHKFEDRAKLAAEQEKIEIEFRLREIRDEYDREVASLRAQLETQRQRERAESRELERERKRQFDIVVKESEVRLDKERHRLESRIREFVSIKEQFDLVQQEWNTRKEAEVQALQLEKERLERREASRAEFEENALRNATEKSELQAHEQTERIASLESRVQDVTKKLASAGAQNFELRQKLDERLGVEVDARSCASLFQNELTAAQDQLRRLKLELQAASDKLREMANYEELREENLRLKQQVLQRLCLPVQASDSPEVRSLLSRLEAAAAQHRVAENASALRIRELQMALTMMSDRHKTVVQERNYLRDQVRLLRKAELKRLAKQAAKGMPSPAPSPPSSPDLSSSDGDSDVRDIRKRLRNLNQLSKNLDSTADALTGGMLHTRSVPQEWDSADLDDFCRQQHSFVNEGLAQPSASTRQEPTNKQEVETHKSTRIASPEHAATTRVVKQQDRPSAPSQNLHSTQTSSNAQTSASTKVESEAKVVVEPQASASAENPLFDGVDPVMAQYMSLVLKQRSEPQHSPQPNLAAVSPDPVLDDIITPSLQLDKPAQDNDDFDW